MYSKFSKTPSNLPSDDYATDAQFILGKIIKYWYLFAASIFICLSLATVYGYFAPSVWKISSKILVEDQIVNLSKPVKSNETISSLSSSTATKNNADNEIEVLRSRSLMAEVVSQLHLNVRTYAKSGLKYQEVYDNLPFNIIVNSSRDTINSQECFVKIISDSNYQLKNSNENVNQTAYFGKSVTLPQFKFTLNKTILVAKQGKYKITIQSIDEAVSELLENFYVQFSNNQATSIDLVLNYPNPKKGEVILNKLTTVYLHNNLVGKNSIADSTVHFINKRLAVVNKRLGEIEKQLQQYKQENKIADVSEQSKALVAGAKDYYNKLNQIEVQLDVVQDINNYLSKAGNTQAVPGSLTTKDSILGKSIYTYNRLIVDREKVKTSSNADSNALQKISSKTDTVRKALLKNIALYQRNLIVSKAKLNKQNAVFTGKIKQVPIKEKTYLDYVRQQNVQQELSLFLLQKREEIAISKTSSVQNARIIDAAKSDFLPFKPKKSIIYIFGLILGLILPAIYLFIKELFNIRINNKEDIQKITSIPILGEINHESGSKMFVVDESNGTVIAEQFRKIAAGLQYILHQQKSKVLLFTSSMSGEGKSFLSLNLGNALGRTGKKVVFIELDLRKPKLSESIGMDNSYGYTNYAISDTISVNDVLKPLWFHANCFLIASGEIPPNPAELLTNPRLEEMINELKSRFDYIIIDCSPVGLVTDALLIEKLADLVLYVIREKYTYKSQLGIVNDLKEAGKVKNLYLIVNDVQPEDKEKSYFNINFSNKKAKEQAESAGLRSILPED